MTEQGIAGLDVQAIETEIGRLPEVVACRIVADAVGRPLEVHVLAHPGKHPKQVVRDVQSVALASFGLEIDRRIVSVVQLTPTGPVARGSVGDGKFPDRHWVDPVPARGSPGDDPDHAVFGGSGSDWFRRGLQRRGDAWTRGLVGDAGRPATAR